MLIKLYKLDDDKNEPLATLAPGEHIIGRGPILKCNDKRVSRKHAIFKVDEENASLTPIHINPCFFIAASSETNHITVLDKDVATKINNGDQFAVLPDSHWYRIELDVSDPKQQTANGQTNRLQKNISRTQPQHSAISGEDTIKKASELAANTFSYGKDTSQGASTSTEETVNSVNKIEKRQLETDDGIRKKPKITDENLEKLLDTIKQIETTDFVAASNSIDKPQGENLKVEEQSCVKQREVMSDSEPDNDVKDASNMEVEDKKPNIDDIKLDAAIKKENTQEQNTSSAPSTSSKRDRCWYGENCYRKNPSHRTEFSHPGDKDYEDNGDVRPECPYGTSCYRKNKDHRKNYKHSLAPAKQPEMPKRKRKAAQKQTSKSDLSEDDYDYDDPFIDDCSSDEFVLSSDESDTEWEDSQKVEEGSQETRRLIKEAKRITRGK